MTPPPIILHENYLGYQIRVPTSGGKAGKGCNKTSTIQVLRIYNPDFMVQVKAFRFTVTSEASRKGAMQKVREWIVANPVSQH